MPETNKPRILITDIETSPNLAHVWGLWQQNVSLSQLMDTTSMISFAAKWYGERNVEFYSDHHDGHAKMVKQAHRLLDEADIVVTYNGVTFDIKHFQREFILAGMNPPSPFRNVDLLKVVKSQFRFPSNKLQHVSDQLGIGQKTPHTGHELWVKCMAGDVKAWALMKKYNNVPGTQPARVVSPPPPAAGSGPTLAAPRQPVPYRGSTPIGTRPGALPDINSFFVNGGQPQ